MRKRFVTLCSCLAVAACFGFAEQIDEVINSPLATVSEVFRRPDVQKELEVVDDQAQVFERIRRDFAQQADELTKEQSPQQDLAAMMQRSERLLQLLRKLHQDKMAERQEVLLAFKLRRVDGLTWQ